jgi:dissimilatory sulfite reductase (desulfoviridin) alpha/beta subunit
MVEMTDHSNFEDSEPNGIAVAEEMPRDKGKVDHEELKKSGYIFQRDAEYFTVRLRIPGGTLSSDQIAVIGEIARKYGRGTVHLTIRQGVEIPWVSFVKLGEVTKALDKVGTPPGSCGPRVRNITACVGLPTCNHANIDSQALVKRLDERFFDVVLPTKLKIAVAGCPNSCSDPWINDIGIIGRIKPGVVPEKCKGCGACVRVCRESAVDITNGMPRIAPAKCLYCGECTRACMTGAITVEKEGYSILIGGNTGRHPRFAYRLVDFADEETLFRVIENCIRLLKEEGKRGERFSRLIERLGLVEAIKKRLL